MVITKECMNTSHQVGRTITEAELELVVIARQLCEHHFLPGVGHLAIRVHITFRHWNLNVEVSLSSHGGLQVRCTVRNGLASCHTHQVIQLSCHAT